MPWADAEYNCVAKYNGHLASFHNATQLSAVYYGVGATGSPWIGLTDSVTEDTWAWTDKSTVNFTPWSSNQPDNWQSNEDCVQTSASSWNDLACSSSLSSICLGEFWCDFGPFPPTPPQSARSHTNEAWIYPICLCALAFCTHVSISYCIHPCLHFTVHCSVGHTRQLHFCANLIGQSVTASVLVEPFVSDVSTWQVCCHNLSCMREVKTLQSTRTQTWAMRLATWLAASSTRNSIHLYHHRELTMVKGEFRGRMMNVFARTLWRCKQAHERHYFYI